ncbi:LysR family transcriptional regulator [Sphingobium sp. B2]|uniref:LysR family transcriptional regulator n=1 Tax=Sphingobium sp. B2 TaxID=2583228 RepID=UPI0011A37D17|nr:LysR family transcriptional regulator [Sphingobium sp. B2]
MIRLADIGLAELQVFDAVYRYRSVIEASRSLDLPQPTVSRWLAKLRNHFRDTLFVRTPRGMEPTRTAEAIAGPVRDMLQIYRDRLMQERSFDPATTARNFRIAASDFGQLTVLPALDRWAAQTAPRARFSAIALGRETLPEGLETGEIDLAVGGFPALASGIIEQTLYEDEYVCAFRQNHPLAGDGALTLSSFQSARHIVVSARIAGHVHQQVEDQLLATLVPENVRLTSYAFSLAPMLIGETDLILTIPRRVAGFLQSQLGLAIVRPPIELPRFRVKQYWHERSKHDPGHRWLRQGIVELLSNRARK